MSDHNPTANPATGAHVMTDQINTGGAAFPCETSSTADFNEGMTLRDYFAAKAMEAIIAADGIQYASATKAHAKWAYEQADAMLAARGGAL